jgi:nitroimidazol reductase NimA-like FMN-containing flavoprotein (pyridoxamine 5'-phosphate oxidase superfamily)
MAASASEARGPRRRQIRLTADEEAAFLRDNPKCALATIDQDGFPHVVAMGPYVEDGVFYMTSCAKAQKLMNVRRSPECRAQQHAAGHPATRSITAAVP